MPRNTNRGTENEASYVLIPPRQEARKPKHTIALSLQGPQRLYSAVQAQCCMPEERGVGLRNLATPTTQIIND